MTNLRIVPGDRLDVEMVRELRKLDKTFVIFGIAMVYMYVHFNHKIIKLEDELSKMKRKAYDTLTYTYDDYKRDMKEMKEKKSKED